MYKEYLDRIVEFCSGDRFSDELYKAREKYFQIIGKIYDDEPSYGNRMNLFLYWYIFNWVIENEGITPADLFYREFENSFSPAELEVFSDFRYTFHSLFLLKKIKKNNIIIIDLFSKKEFDIFERRENFGINKCDLFEARIIPFKSLLMFTPGSCIHPFEVKDQILNEIKKEDDWTKDEKFIFIQKLSHMKLKLDRYKHVDVKAIYVF